MKRAEKRDKRRRFGATEPVALVYYAPLWGDEIACARCTVRNRVLTCDYVPVGTACARCSRVVARGGRWRAITGLDALTEAVEGDDHERRERKKAKRRSRRHARRTGR